MKLQLWRSLLLGLCLSNAIAPQLLAQISPDGTTNTNVDTTDGVINIEQGDRSGDNLFHSFEEFSVPNGSEAFFNNQSDIVNIFSRVTGGDISNIDGLIGANGDASLFLINPAGIIFGEGAALDLGGSFTASTAESIVFTDNVEFSTTDATEPPLLTINQPLGLNFGNNPGDIAVNGSNLEVNNSETLALFGGNVTITGGQIIAPEANIELGGLTAAGQISFTQSEDTFNSFSFPEAIARGNVTLTNVTNVNVRAAGGGNIKVNARNLVLSGASNLRTGITPESNSTEAQAGNINLNATEDITVSQESRIDNRVGELGVGNAGEIKINTNNLFLKEGGRVSATTEGQGNAGTVTINASGNISADGESESSQFPSGIYSQVVGEGESGGIEITTSNLSLTQGGQVNASTAGQGNAGAIVVNALDTISVDGEASDGLSSSINSTVLSTGEGDSGGIDLTTANLSITQGGRVRASTFGQGDAGAIVVNALDTISVDGEAPDGSSSLIGSEVSSKAVGDSGGIDLTTSNLSVTQGGRVNASTAGQGNAGAIVVNASDTISVDGEPSDGSPSFIYSVVVSTGVGDSGGIDLTTSNLSVTQGGQVSASTTGQGNAGAVTINASDTISVDGESPNGSSSFIYSVVRPTGVGESGGIDLTTSNLSLTQGGRVSASTAGQGNAGAVTINASDTISVDGEASDGSSSSIDSGVLSTGVGESGGIDLTTSNLSLTQGGRVSASTVGRGNAGAVTINASDTISVDGEAPDGSSSSISSAVSSTGVGDSGGINLTTSNLSVAQGGRVSASTSGRGNAREITINASDTISVDGGGLILATAFGQGNAGNLTITASESIELVGSDGEFPSGLFANTIEGSGDGGDLTIATDKLIVRDEAVVTVGNFQQVVGNREPRPPGTGAAGNLEINAGSVEVGNRGKITADNANGIGGDLTLNADSMTLENEASVSASTIAESGQGGIVTLNIDDSLIMRDRSLISARADSGASGGNIEIDADFVIAQPNQNNDIIAAAAEGTGGDINVTTNAIFGLESRSSTPPNNTNDIDASSEFGLDGTVEINELNVNPTEALEELPVEVIDVTGLVAQNLCRQGQGSEFVVTGKGGTAPSPTQARDGSVSEVDLVKPVPFSEVAATQAPAREESSEIIEAQGWVVNDRGMVELVATKTDIHGSPARSTVQCHKQ